MAVATKRPNVPVFVSSTFTDMRVYRRKVQDTLTQLGAIVRGMEQFDSKPGSPVEECLAVVQSCQLYVGVFGMRYGTIPEGHEKSMTHIEYASAPCRGRPRNRACSRTSCSWTWGCRHPVSAVDPTALLPR
jgi:hypothetical protein